MQKNLVFCFFLSFCLSSMMAQDLVYDNHIYEDRIHTARLFSSGTEYAYPILFLNDMSPLTLVFDEWIQPEDNYSHFNIEYIQCDANWQPSPLMPIQFYDGMFSPTITDYNYSENPIIPYVHYTFSFPQEGEKFKMSGNYILYVYRDGDKDAPVMTKRFLVVDEQMEVKPILTLSAQMLRQRFQDFHFEVTNTNGCTIYNPNTDMKVLLLQNFRWDNAQELTNTFYMDKTYRFDVDINKAFDSGNEFRTFDVSSTRFYGRLVESVAPSDTGYNVYLRRDLPRPMNVFNPLPDYNGAFINNVLEYQNPPYNADYVKVHFTLATDVYPQMEVFVMGSFCDWQPLNENKMTYNERLNQYEAEIWVKQGQYDYLYMMKNPVTGKIIESAIEGKRTNSENFYTVLVYCKNPTDFSHRLVAYFPYNY